MFAQVAMGTAFEHLASRTIILLEKFRSNGEPINTLAISGGVAASPFLQHFFRQFLDVRGFPNVGLIIPPPEYCTDNAAMIAWTGLELFKAGFRSDMGCNALAKWSMDPTAEDGGITGVGGWTSPRCGIFCGNLAKQQNRREDALITRAVEATYR